jgi:LmbE family N-acetylglucosaminyl deacetylase
VSRADAGEAARLDEHLGALVERLEPEVVLAPLGIGRHVDHLLVRDAARRLAASTGVIVVHYSDFPYCIAATPDASFVRGLVPHTWMGGRTDAADLFAGYRTQFLALFPTGVVPLRPELYWVDSAVAASCA